MSIVRILACLAAALVLTVAHAAQRGAGALDPVRLRDARQRWEQLSPKEQAEARANYDRYLALSEDERAELHRRARATRDALAKLHEELPAEARARLAALDPAKRREVLRDMHEAQAEEAGRRIRSKLPEDLLERLERAEPGDRAAMLRRFQEQQRGRVARGAIELLGRRLGLPASEIRRRQSLPEDERAELVLAMRAEAQAEDSDETGLPPGLTWEQWEAWSRLPPREFFARIMEFRQRSIEALEAGAKTGSASATDPAAADDARPDAGGRGAGRGSASPGAVRDRGDASAVGAAERPRMSRTPGVDQPLPRVLRRLSTALRPDPRDALELIELTSPERQRAMSVRRRARCMQLMLGERLLPQDRMLELESLPDEAFFDFVRQMLRHSGYLGTGIDRDDEGAGVEPRPAPERARRPAGGEPR